MLLLPFFIVSWIVEFVHYSLNMDRSPRETRFSVFLSFCLSITLFFFILSAVDASVSVCGRFVKLFELSGSLVRLISLHTPDGGEKGEPRRGHPAHTRPSTFRTTPYFSRLRPSLLHVSDLPACLQCCCQRSKWYAFRPIQNAPRNRWYVILKRGRLRSSWMPHYVIKDRFLLEINNPEADSLQT